MSRTGIKNALLALLILALVLAAGNPAQESHVRKLATTTGVPVLEQTPEPAVKASALVYHNYFLFSTTTHQVTGRTCSVGVVWTVFPVGDHEPPPPPPLLPVAPLSTPAPLQPAPQAFTWEDDTLKAFVKAVEYQRPFVVLFGYPSEYRSPEGTNATNRARAEFDTPALRALQDEAVFALGFPDRDEFARRMALHLRLTVYPTLSIIRPNTDKLTEHYRMEGAFPAAEVAADLNKHLPTAVLRPGQPTPNAAPAAQPGSQLSETDKAAIRNAVNAYAGALRGGDLDQVARLTAQPFGFLYEQGFESVRRVGRAKRAVLRAMDERFGNQADIISFGPDDDRIRQQMMRLKELFVLDYDTAIGRIVTLKVEATLTTGGTENWTLVAVRPTQPDGSWAVWPRRGGLAGLGVGTSDAWRDSMKKLATAYESLADEIKNGRYNNRVAAGQAVFGAYTRAMSPAFGGTLSK